MAKGVNGTGNEAQFSADAVPSVAFSLPYPTTNSAPGSPVVNPLSNAEAVVPKPSPSQLPQHDWSPAAAGALDAVRKRLGVDH
jgi:hypothetical protein